MVLDHDLNAGKYNVYHNLVTPDGEQDNKRRYTVYAFETPAEITADQNNTFTLKTTDYPNDKLSYCWQWYDKSTQKWFDIESEDSKKATFKMTDENKAGRPYLNYRCKITYTDGDTSLVYYAKTKVNYQ